MSIVHIVSVQCKRGKTNPKHKICYSDYDMAVKMRNAIDVSGVFESIGGEYKYPLLPTDQVVCESMIVIEPVPKMNLLPREPFINDGSIPTLRTYEEMHQHIPLRS